MARMAILARMGASPFRPSLKRGADTLVGFLGVHEPIPARREHHPGKVFNLGNSLGVLCVLCENPFF
jgi:hypothetical protein